MSEDKISDFFERVEYERLKEKFERKKNELEKKFVSIDEKKTLIEEDKPKTFLICGDENEKGECCLWEKGHKGEHEYYSEKEVHASARIITDEELKKEADEKYEKQKKDLQDSLERHEPKYKAQKKHGTYIEQSHSKRKLLLISLGFIAAVIILFVLVVFTVDFNEIDIIPIPFDDFDINPFDSEEIETDIIPEERQPPDKPIIEDDESDSENLDGRYEIFTERSWRTDYSNGAKKPIQFSNIGNYIVGFDCWNENNIDYYFSIFQNVEGDGLKIQVWFNDKMVNEKSTDANKPLILEGICP